MEFRKFTSILLNKSKIKERIKVKIRTYIDLNVNENATYHVLNTAKSIFEEEDIALTG